MKASLWKKEKEKRKCQGMIAKLLCIILSGKSHNARLSTIIIAQVIEDQFCYHIQEQPTCQLPCQS